MIEVTERPSCPDPEALGVFAEGKASPADVATIREHLATCNDCIEEVGEVTRVTQEAVPANVVPLRGAARRLRWLAAAAAIVVAAGGAGVWRTVLYDPADALRRSLPADSRVIEPRLYRFPFRDYGAKRSAEGLPPHYQLDAAAGKIIERAGETPSDKMKHAAALAKLLEWTEKGNVDEALKALEELAVAHPDDARIWSDLAAARAWAAGWDSKLYPLALQAADRAHQLDPELREPLYNRALILERMDDPRAKAAWEEFIRTESDEAWKQEAREKHLDQLQ
jgi:tetratricopeptide (TPR) repeat protein